MKKNELKQVLRPLIKECIREVVFEEGLLSGIVTEVVTGLSNAQGRLVESAPLPPSRPEPRVTEQQQLAEAQRRQEKLKQTRKKMLDAIGQSSYNGVNLFEGTEPISKAGTPGGHSGAQGPLSGVDPNDAGVDITAFFGSQTRKF